MSARWKRGGATSIPPLTPSPVSPRLPPQLCGYISDIASNMMLVEEHVLWMAQNEARACTRIVQCVERIADLALAGDNRAISKVTLTLDYPTERSSPLLFFGVGNNGKLICPEQVARAGPGEINCVLLISLSFFKVSAVTRDKGTC